MMNELHSFVNKHWKKPENGLMQVLIMNALAFVGLLLLKGLLVVAGYATYYQLLLQYLYLPATWKAFLYQPWSLFTYFWAHTHFFPVFWNLLLLHLFGKLIMDLLGSRHFLALYWLGGIAGGLLFLLLYNIFPRFQGAAINLSGMEASLYAMMAAAATLAPQFSFGLFFLGRIQLKYIVGFALLLAFYSLASDYPAEGMAQLGGALLGYVYVKQAVGSNAR